VELRHLRYFVAVAEELHFRRAAERLYVAQPAVSEQIRKLEAELGVRLFDRTNRNVALTNPGKALLGEARRVLHQAELARLAARNAGDDATLRLRIGYVSDSLPSNVLRAVQQVANGTPNVEVSLETGSALGLIDSLRDQWLDAVVAGLPAPTKGLRVTTLGDQRVVAALPVMDARAVHSELTLERLAPDRLVVLPRDANPAFYDAVVSLCRQAGLPTTLVEVAEPRVDAVLMAVATSGAAAILPASVTERYSTPGVRLVDLVGVDAAFESAVLTHPDTDNLAVAALLRAIGRTIERSSRTEVPAPLLVAA
jgi:DNA-binding transcriptional LysR family regulator